MKEKGREKKKEREKRKRKEKKDELSSRSSLSVTTPRYIPHFRGQETGPAITHSCICHELNLVIGYIRWPISFLEQQVSLMNDYRGGGEGSASRGGYVSVITDRRGERSSLPIVRSSLLASTREADRNRKKENRVARVVISQQESLVVSFW